MSTIDRVVSRATGESEIPSGEGRRIAIVRADWNIEVTGALYEGAVETLKKYGVKKDDINLVRVPGAFELVAGSAYQQKQDYDAIIAIGCVVRGGTPHFDYICQGVTNGLAKLNAEKPERPVIFCVLTTDTMQDALDRAGGALGNKGSEAAEAALIMAALHAPRM